MRAAQQQQDWERFPPPAIHISRFHNSEERFVALGFARSLVLSPGVNSSVTVGFRLTPDLYDKVRFLTDPAISHVIINETCERCPLPDCDERAAPPILLAAEQQKQARYQQLQKLRLRLST